MQLDLVDELIESLRGVVNGLDFTSLGGEHAALLVERFTTIERLAWTGRSLAARRVADTGYYQRDGARDAGSWLATVTGDSKQAAEEALATAATLELLPELDAAVRSGELSGKQAHHVARAGALDPDATGPLLETARREPLGRLRAAADEAAAAARSKEEDEERYRRVHSERHLRTWTTAEGAFAGRFSLTPEAGALLMGPLERIADAVFEQAWREDRHEPRDAYLADALVYLARGAWPGESPADGKAPAGLSDPMPAARRPEPDPDEGPPRPRHRYRPDFSVIMRIDLAALVRGRLLPGEECSIDGVGHVPVAVVQEYLDRAMVRLVVTDGIDVRSIYSFKRNVSVALDTALRFRDRTCVVPGCGSTFHLERDHVREFAKEGPTALENMCLLCARHHRMKSAKGYRIEGSPGQWKWLRPDGSQAGP